MHPNFTRNIILALFLGLITGAALKFIPDTFAFKKILIDDILATGGKLFINLLQMLVVPVVFVSLVCGVSSLKNIKTLGRIGIKTLSLYIITTIIALSIGIIFAATLKIGSHVNLTLKTDYSVISPPPLIDVILNLVPNNPVNAMANGNMLQLIIFSVFLGTSMTMAGKNGQACRNIFIHFNEVLMKLVYLVMVLAPMGIFFLLSSMFARQGIDVFMELIQYIVLVMIILFIQLTVTYSLFLKYLGKLNPLVFFKKMYNAMLFACGVSSSNASIPVVLETVEKRLGVKDSIAAFVIPLGASINMDGTAIMQSVATVFIANAYHINIGISGYLTVIIMTTLASIGTAGVPGVGVIMLTMVLQQVGLPIEGTALIISVDRLIDMSRTAVNICGDAMIACVVAKSENSLNEKVYIQALYRTKNH